MIAAQTKSVGPGREITGAYFILHPPQWALPYLLLKWWRSRSWGGRDVMRREDCAAVGWKLLMRDLPQKYLPEWDLQMQHQGGPEEPSSVPSRAQDLLSRLARYNPPRGWYWPPVFRKLHPGLVGVLTLTVQRDCAPNSTLLPHLSPTSFT